MRPIATYPAVVGQVLAKHRKSRSITQQQIAQKIGVGQTAWSKIEKGTVPITIEQLALVAAVLGTTPSKLLAQADAVVEEARKRGFRVFPKRVTDESLAIAVVGVAALALLVAAVIFSDRE